jgi:hypothetical protein
VAARAAVVRRGGVGRGLAEAGKRWVRCWRGTWCGEERCGAAGAQENSRRGRRGHGREAEQGEGLEVEDKD